MKTPYIVAVIAVSTVIAIYAAPTPSWCGNSYVHLKSSSDSPRPGEVIGVGLEANKPNGNKLPAAPPFPAVPDSLPEIKDYKRWTRVSPEGYRITGPVASACRAPTPGPPPGPHADRDVAIYVNAAGAADFIAPQSTPMPVGTIVVKQKTGSKGEVELGVMIKRGPGYDEQGGDWEYLYASGPDLKTITRGKLANCADCHASPSAKDHLFRYCLGETTKSTR
jgi:hypothetical protein